MRRWILCGLITLVGCVEQGEPIVDGPFFDLEPKSLEISAVTGGANEAPISFMVWGGVLVEEVTVDPPDAPFRLELEPGPLNPPDQSVSVPLVFEPKARGDHPARIVVRASAPPGAIAIDVVGHAGFAELVAEPSPVDFGNVAVGGVDGIEVRVENRGDTTVSLVPEATAGFALDCDRRETAVFCGYGDTPVEVPPGEGRSVSLAFAPTLAAVERATFRLTCLGGGCELEVPLSGQGVEQALTCVPELDFGFVNPETCVARQARCSNQAAGPVEILEAELPPGSAFEHLPSCVGTTLTAGETCDISVQHCAASLGTISREELTVRAVHPVLGAELQTISLRAESGGPDLRVEPGAADFGPGALFAPVKRRLRLANIGAARLNIAELVVEGAAAGAFTVPPAEPYLDPGSDLDLDLLFQPDALGPFEADLVVRSDDPDMPEAVVPLTGRGVDVEPCSYEVRPESLDFFEVERGQSVGAWVAVENVGDGACLVTGAELLSSEPVHPFSVVEPLSTATIASGATAGLLVRFSPIRNQAESAELEIGVASPTRPFVQVPIRGSDTESPVLVAPQEIELGSLPASCGTRWKTVSLYNRSDAPVTVEEVTLLDGAPFSLVRTSTPPFTLAPLEAASFSVGFDASFGAGRRGGRIRVEVSGSGATWRHLVAIDGTGRATSPQVDTFTQQDQAAVDLLFVLDHSGCMGQEHLLAETHFGSSIADAALAGLDFQVGVTTTDIDDEAGRLVHPDPSSGNAFGGPQSHRIITAESTPSPETVFQQSIPARPLTGGSAMDESPFEAARLALSNPLRAGDNAGFLRPNARLAVIGMTDEPEQSSGTVDFYLQALRRTKGEREPERVMFSSIAGDAPNGCDGPNGAAAAAPRMAEMAARSGGELMSICSTDWAGDVARLSSAAFGTLARFPLTSEPDQSTVRVEIDGVQVPDTLWTVDEAGYLSFAATAVPPPGSEIRIAYTPLCP